MHSLEGSGGLRLVVHEYGKHGGVPILMIHGLGGCHLVWSKQYLNGLEDEFRLLCLDIRGHGMSEKPTNAEHYTQSETWAEDLHAVIRALELDKPIVVGWSYAGFMIGDYLTKYGDRALGGIVFDCAGVLLGVEKAAGMFGPGFTEHVQGLCSDCLEDNIQAVRSFVHAMPHHQPGPEELETMIAFSMVVPPTVRRAMVSRSIDHDEALRALAIPVLVIEGSEDTLLDPSHTRHLRACVPHSKHVVYANTGHAPHFEAPDRFNHELADLARACAG